MQTELLAMQQQWELAIAQKDRLLEEQQQLKNDLDAAFVRMQQLIESKQMLAEELASYADRLGGNVKAAADALNDEEELLKEQLFAVQQRLSELQAVVPVHVETMKDLSLLILVAGLATLQLIHDILVLEQWESLLAPVSDTADVHN